MADRKVLVNYVHPDIDPSLLGRRKKPKVEKNGKIEVRTMLPFNLQCDACKNYMYAGKKFNGKKEVVQGETYMGVKILRFYIKCTTCSASITFKTDPQNSGYTCEFGASRNIEGWREDQVNAAEEREQAKIEEEKRKKREELGSDAESGADDNDDEAEKKEEAPVEESKPEGEEGGEAPEGEGVEKDEKQANYEKKLKQMAADEAESDDEFVPLELR